MHKTFDADNLQALPAGIPVYRFRDGYSAGAWPSDGIFWSGQPKYGFDEIPVIGALTSEGRVTGYFITRGYLGVDVDGPQRRAFGAELRPADAYETALRDGTAIDLYDAKEGL